MDDLSNSGPAIRLYCEGRVSGRLEDRYRRSDEKVIVIEFVSLDGVIPALGRPEDGFAYGGWEAPSMTCCE